MSQPWDKWRFRERPLPYFVIDTDSYLEQLISDLIRLYKIPACSIAFSLTKLLLDIRHSCIRDALDVILATHVPLALPV